MNLKLNNKIILSLIVTSTLVISLSVNRFKMLQIFTLTLVVSAKAGKMEPFIVGGQDASIEEWPFIAFVEISMFGFFATAGCGGSLLSSQTVLTAAHCLDDLAKKKWAFGVNFRIFMGHESFWQATMTRKVLEYKTHENYSPYDDSVRYDIGIMFLVKPVSFSSDVRRAILQPSFDDEDGQPLAVAGWGRTVTVGISGFTKRLKAVNLGSSAYKCGSLDGVICIEISDGYAYTGDSGGPMVNTDTRYLVGIVSFRDMKSKISAFTSIPEYRPWIKRTQINMFQKYCGKKK